MANELRVRGNFLGGIVDDNPLVIGATSLASSSLAAIPAIGATQHFPIIIDPYAVAGPPEIAYVIVHTALDITATIVRGREGTSARQHLQNTPWIHGLTIKDFDGSGGGSGLIGSVSYNPTANTTLTRVSGGTSFADVDATNLVVPFIGPPSGSVSVRLCAGIYMSSAGGIGQYWNLRDSSGDIANSGAFMMNTNVFLRMTHIIKMSGLTPGTSYSWKWGWKVDGAVQANMTIGKTLPYGPAIMDVMALNV